MRNLERRRLHTHPHTDAKKDLDESDNPSLKDCITLRMEKTEKEILPQRFLVFVYGTLEIPKGAGAVLLTR